MEKVKSYSDLLKDPRWQKRRLEIMQRDNFTCQLCFDNKETLNVHHKLYIAGRKPWEYDDDQLITYCRVCHKVVELLKPNNIDPIVVNKIELPVFTMVNCVYDFHNNRWLGGVELLPEK